jgi:Flp pilus assembly protein TadD
MIEARRQYGTFAQEQLARAVGREPLGSLALYALGKLEATLAEDPAAAAAEGRSRALIYQQAALLADPTNPLAANELGVLLARAGRLEEARDWLRHSALSLRAASAWHNLAVVHGQLGETRLADLARREALQAADAERRPLAAGKVPVDFVAPEVFVASAGAGTDAPAPQPAAGNPTANRGSSGGAPAAARPRSGGAARFWE